MGEDSPIPNTRGIRNDMVEALRQINIPNLRWPDGCFADELSLARWPWLKSGSFHRVNAYWGNVIEINQFGTHEFIDLCSLLDCEPYICDNVGSGTVQELRDWLEYIT